MLNSYHDYYYKQYLTKSWTWTHLFCIATAYVVISLPFYFCFGGQNFWIDPNQQVMTVSYNYTGYYAIQVNSVLGGSSATDQFINIQGNSASYPSGRSAVLTVTDQSTLGSVSLIISNYSTNELTSVNVIMYYNVYLSYLAKSVVTGLMWSIQGNALSASVSAVVQFNHNSPISAIQSNKIVNLPPYYPNLSGGFTFNDLANQLTATSSLLKHSSQTRVQKDTSSSPSRSIGLNLVKIKNVVVGYYPTILETLKFKYSTYLAFAIICYFVFYTLLRLYLRQGMLDSVTVVERAQ